MSKLSEKNYVTLCAILSILFICQSAWARTTVKVGSDSSKYVIEGKLVTPDEVIDGKLVIEDDIISCVGNNCEEPTGATIFTVTNAYVFPGFIDAHNHVAYNILPKWNPQKIYKNRSQWQREKSYNDFKKPYNSVKDKGLYCEMVKYGEIKALISGVTTIQGTSPASKCIKTLVRNAENQNELKLSSSYIRTYILDISSFEGSLDTEATKSFIVHIGEGIDDKSRNEFKTLKQKKLLTAETVIIHGTAFGESEFKEMGNVGAKLVWSPQSNLALYNQTTDVKTALKNGVHVSLGVDWNPSGSDNIFDELRVADQVNEEEFERFIPESDWIKMITSVPAEALALDKYIGRLKPGLKADITVVRSKDQDFSKSLLKSHLEDVEMVWVSGDLLYGNESIVNKIKPGECDQLRVHGSNKRVCVKDTQNPVPKSSETLTDIIGKLQPVVSNLAPLVP